MQKSGTFSEQLTYCNGQNAALVTSLTCTIPLITLQGSPYSLLLGDSIYAVVTASNVYGESSISSEGNGATVVTVPNAQIGLATKIATNT